jgi:hypothetical protein
MARRTDPMRPARNTAPMWKKVSVLLSAPVAVILVTKLLNAEHWSFAPYVLLVIGVAAAAVWGSAKLLGVRLSLRSWD